MLDNYSFFYICKYYSFQNKTQPFSFLSYKPEAHRKLLTVPLAGANNSLRQRWHPPGGNLRLKGFPAYQQSNLITDTFFRRSQYLHQLRVGKMGLLLLTLAKSSVTHSQTCCQSLGEDEKVTNLAFSPYS